MKVLVIGASGQVGRELMATTWWPEVKITGVGRHECDITDAGRIERVLAQIRPDIVINAAAFTAVDRAEHDTATAIAVNHHGPAHIAAAANRASIRLIHLSTDYVFDGNSARPYRETDAVSPINAYGRSKAAGEEAVRNAQPRHIILRTSWVHASHGENFVRTMLRLAGQRDEVSVVDDQIGTPTSAHSIAAALTEICRHILASQNSGREPPWGTYHFTDSGETSRHGFAAHIFDNLERRGLRRPRLNAIETSQYPVPARRPPNSRLDCTLIEKTYGIVRVPWQESLNRVLDESVESAAQPASGNTRHG